MLIAHLGWPAAALLLATLVLETWVRWSGAAAVRLGFWILAGQIGAWGGLLLYSAFLGNPVFIAVSAMLLVASLLVRRARRERRLGGAPRSRPVAAVRCAFCGAAITLRHGARGFETSSGRDFREKCRRLRDAAGSEAFIAAADCPEMARAVARVTARLRREDQRG